MTATEHREPVMSVDHQPTQTDSQGLPKPDHGTRRGWLLVLLGVLVAVLVAAGVAFAVTRDDGSSDLDLSAPPATAPATSDGDPAPAAAVPAQSAIEVEGPAILAQFAKFWTTVDSLGQVPANERAAVWGQVATGRSYDRTLMGTATADAAGEAFYGQTKIDPTILSVEDGVAQIRSCQDSSQTGRMKKATGEKVTVGRANEVLLATMMLGTDGIWRVSEATYPEGQSC